MIPLSFRVFLLTLLGFSLGTAAYATGFPNVAQTPGALLSGPNAPEQGRTALVAYHGDLLVTIPEKPSSPPGSDYDMRSWDISDPANPVELQNFGGTNHPFNAHGYLKSGTQLLVEGAPENSINIVGPGQLEYAYWTGPSGRGDRGGLMRPWEAKVFLSYHNSFGEAWLGLDGVQTATWDHLNATGVVGHPIFIGNLLIYASDQSNTGIATYDVSDPANPVLLDVLNDGGIGGYWPEIWKHYVVFPRRKPEGGFQMVDFSDPTDLRLVCDRPLDGGIGSGPMYASFQDEYGFFDRHKVDMRNCETVLALDESGHNIDTSQYSLPIGNLVATGGNGVGVGMAIWAHQAEPDTRGPFVAYHIPQNDRTGYPVDLPIGIVIHETLKTETIEPGVNLILRSAEGENVEFQYVFSMDDVLTLDPLDALTPDTTYEVIFVEGGIEDAAGNGMQGYSFRFSTGSSVDGGNAPPHIQHFEVASNPSDPNTNMSFSIEANDPEGETLQYRFDFGHDGASTGWQSSSEASYVYPESGHFRVTAQARDTQGSITTESTVVTVITAPEGPTPTASSQLACIASARQIWTVNPDNDTLTLIDADSNVKLQEHEVGEDPRGVAAAPDETLWVTLHDADAIVQIGAAGNVIRSINTGYGSAPFGIVLSPDGSRAYASLYGSGELIEVDTATGSILSRLTLGPTPRALALSGDGQTLLISRFISPINHGEVWEVDTSSMTLVRTIRLLKSTEEDTNAQGRGVPNYLSAISISPDGSRALVVGKKDNVDRGLLNGGNNGNGFDLSQDQTVRAMMATIELDTGAENRSLRIDIDNSGSPSALKFSPLGDYLFIVLQDNNQVAVHDYLAHDASAGNGSIISRIPVGHAPQGICIDDVTEQLFVKNFTSRSITSIGVAALLSSGGTNSPTLHVSTVANEKLAADVLNGKRLFYHASDPRMSAEGYLSCATCHIDGGHDGRSRDFTGRGEGLRNTMSLQGHFGTSIGNVHWSGNFDEIQDFEHDIRDAFGGNGFMVDSDFTATNTPLGAVKTGLSVDLDELAAYVSSLGSESIPRSPYRTSDGQLTPAAQRGASIFIDLDCHQCHSGEYFSDGQIHDVGTLRPHSGQRLGEPLPGIRTPTLLGLFDTPPYLHDGSAKTLEDVFRLSGGTSVQAEAGVTSNGASILDFNNRPSYYYRAWRYDSVVKLNNNTQSVRFTNIDGGSGGLGQIRLRYTIETTDKKPRQAMLLVNDTPFSITLENQEQTPDGFPEYVSMLESAPVETTLNPSTDNILEVFGVSGSVSPGLIIDEISISTADDISNAQHRVVFSLPATDREDLIDYLLQLDGQSVASIIDTDGDGIPNSTDIDDDNDGMTDDFESEHDLDPLDAEDATEDADEDGMTNIDEYNIGTNPGDPDTDGDGIGDNADNEPLVQSNICGTDPALLSFLTVYGGETLQCAAETSIEVTDTVVVESDGRLELLSTRISLKKGFVVRHGGSLATYFGSPVPQPPL